MNFDQLVERLESVFDEAVVSGTDDELFACGYLRGHFDLVVAQLEMSGETEPDKVMPALREAVYKTRHELSPADQAHINSVLDKLALKATSGGAA
ncbi:YfcL family protein [Idiomarina abyssalis]|uniref:YfcL family protein n=1 Tax=Idiomarina abyssalis TaxID=86102 RepID=UPI00230051E0|nr:YfcL family protein [Idiomarina abyssalis]MDA6066452.1 YfcL family protein [Idiomarina abyssalis]